ncbi:hypothetical protein RhiirA1_457353 [Rhizophagus irregularis]|uniref:DUF7431 domain-containing protein n=1 Tax=Rhizophagus irregularis TaxID=588596 RepID=A0A2N0RYG3_9GLOM|nr:hypothetical protein RhiirA1_457353 [Rhizophagus irregularis]
MNDTLSFANKINNNDNMGGSSLAVIAREDEENIILEKVIYKKSMFLYLKSEPEPDLNCEMNEIIDGYENSIIQIDLGEGKIVKNDFLLIADIDIPNFAKLGVSFENSNIKNSNVITSLTYNIIEYEKMSLKFKLGPTKEFIEVVKGVIDSKDPRKFKNVINSFGQFIPKEIILGGRAYFIARGNSEENADEYTTNIGKQFGSSNFNESDWVESLNDFKYWSCIKFKDPVNVFQTLSEDLHNILEILQNKDAECSIFATVIDKKQKDIFNCQVVWSSTEDPKLIIHCFQNKFRKRQCKLKIMWMIVGYNTSFDFNHLDFDIELEVLKNDFNASNHQAIAKPLDLKYNPSVLCFGIPVLSKLDTSNNSPVIGHYFFDDKENRKFGSYLFFYCLEKNHFVNLPNFTFHTLIISNYSNSNNYGISPFQHMSKIRKILNLLKLDSLRLNPKLISLYSTKNKYGPVFLKQKTSEIKIKYINVNYDQDDCICKCKKLEDNLKYAFLDPKNPN